MDVAQMGCRARKKSRKWHFPLTMKTMHGKKGFVILTKSFVKTGITKTFFYSNKMFSSVKKTFGFAK